MLIIRLVEDMERKENITMCLYSCTSMYLCMRVCMYVCMIYIYIYILKLNIIKVRFV